MTEWAVEKKKDKDKERKKKTFRRKEGRRTVGEKEGDDEIDHKIYPLPKPSSNQLVLR